MLSSDMVLDVMKHRHSLKPVSIFPQSTLSIFLTYHDSHDHVPSYTWSSLAERQFVPFFAALMLNLYRVKGK